MTVAEAVRADLEALGDSPAGAAGLAATALALARELDDDGNSATSKSMCARALVEVMARLREITPEKSADRLDELTARRSKRVGT